MTDPDIGKKFARARKAEGWSRADVAKELGISKFTVGNFERGDKDTAGTTVLAAVALMEKWARKAGGVEPSQLGTGVTKIEGMTNPLDLLIAGLANTVALLKDESLPLHGRLIHCRSQLQYILEHFLADANLPD